MRYIFITLIGVFITFTGCKTQQPSTASPTELKSNQFRGVIQELSTNAQTRREVTTKDVYFSIDNKNYFIKFSEGYVTKDEALKYLGKEITIKGEIKKGEWEEYPPSSFSEKKSAAAPRSGEYIIIDKIYK
jgi:hypothetical protein